MLGLMQEIINCSESGTKDNLSVSGDGATLVVGRPNGRGCVHIFSKYDGADIYSTTPTQVLRNPNSKKGDIFGVSVAVSGDATKLAVTKYSGNIGYILIYELQGKHYMLTEKIPSGGRYRFGSSIALTHSGDILIVKSDARIDDYGKDVQGLYVYRIAV